MAQTLADGRGRPEMGVWYMTTLLSLSILVSYLDRGIIAVLVPHLKQAFALDDVRISMLQGFSFSVPFALASLPVGRLVDRYNRRNIIIAGILFWSVSTMMCGLAGSYWQLFAARSGIGIGEACLMPAAYSLVADSFRSGQRGRALSILSVATAVGGGTSKVLGGALLTLWHGTDVVHLPLLGPVEMWRAVFLVTGLPGFFVALLMLLMREPRRIAPAATQAGVGDFAAHVLRHWRLFVPLYLAFAAVFFFSYGSVLWSPTVLSRIYGYPPGTAGMTSGTIQLACSIVGTIVAGVVGDMLINRDARHGRLRVWLLGLVPVLAAALFLALPGAHFYMTGFALTILATGLLTGVSYPALYDVVSPGMRGRSLAVYLFLANVFGIGGGSFGIALITAHLFADEQALNRSVAIAVGGAAVFSALMILIALRRYERVRLEFQEEIALAVTGRH